MHASNSTSALLFFASLSVALPACSEDGESESRVRVAFDEVFVEAEADSEAIHAELMRPGQDAPLSDMIFDIPYVLAYVAACMTLEPGDLIFTGTPEGVSALAPGCVTAVGMTGFELGRLATPVR